MSNHSIQRVIGKILIGISVLFLLIFHFVVTGTQGESFPRDLLGFAIPTPPTWTSFIPFIGWLIGIIFEMFSLHGLIGLTVFLVLFLVGINLNNKHN